MTNEPAKSFRELIVWQKAHAFVLEAYAFTALFPKHEIYGLTSQLRRAAVSVPANIAEGFRRRSRTDKARIMNIAEGSLEEARYYLILAKDLSYGHDPTLEPRLDEIARLLAAYIRALRAPANS
jgi:four helix bundle protein